MQNHFVLLPMNIVTSVELQYGTIQLILINQNTINVELLIADSPELGVVRHAIQTLSWGRSAWVLK